MVGGVGDRENRRRPTGSGDCERGIVGGDLAGLWRRPTGERELPLCGAGDLSRPWRRGGDREPGLSLCCSGD